MQMTRYTLACIMIAYPKLKHSYDSGPDKLRGYRRRRRWGWWWDRWSCFSPVSKGKGPGALRVNDSP